MKLAFLFFLLAMIPPLSFADEKPPLAVFEQWAKTPEWIRLLHLRKSFGKWQSSVRDFPNKPSFFLSPQGSTDPLAELQETYSLMFEQGSEKARATQCRFLARRDFLARHSKLDLHGAFEACEFSNEWLSKLHSTKISLIFASGYLNSAASSFGHTFLKLQNPENQGGKELLDYGVNFAARTEATQGALYALYGLTGFFPGTFGMAPYHQMIKEYTNLEGRDLWEYELDFSPQEVERVLWHLLELENSYFDYYFLDDNCSYAILKALEVGRPGLQLAGEDELFVIPLDTVKRAEKIFVKRTYRPSLQTIWNFQQNQLTSLQKKKLRSAQEISSWDAETLTAGQTYYSLKAYDDFEKYKAVNYEISRERSKRGKGLLADLPTPPPPERSHNSSAFQAGVLNRLNESRLLTGVRFAFHDELSRNSGLTPFSHLEVVGLQWEKSQLRRYRLLEMLSTEAASSFAWPLSWGASLGGDLFSGSETRIQNFLGGKIGFSLDLVDQKWRWSNFFTATVKQDFEGDFQFVPGAESRLWLIWTSGFRTLFKTDIQKFPSEVQRSWSVDQAVDLNSQLELRGGLHFQRNLNTSFYETQAFLLQNF